MRMKTIAKWWTMFVMLVVMALLVAACGGAAATEKPKVTIKLAENPWAGSAVNVNVAKILLEKELGYKVEIVTIEENAQFSALTQGDLSAVLEIWPSGHAQDYTDYITSGKVDDIGKLGVVGKIGWFIPTYMLKDHPELATWEGFKNPDVVAMFKTAETGEAGQFLAGDPSYVQYDAVIIENLGLNFQVVSSGSEQAELAALDAAYSRNDPFLFYFWTPHSAHAKYDLTKVDLPAYTAECGTKSDSDPNTRDCDYPEDVLYKAAWPGLKEAAPDAYALLKNMSYTNADQISMLAMVDVDGKTPAEAAQAWVGAHGDTWKAWIPAK